MTSRTFRFAMATLAAVSLAAGAGCTAVLPGERPAAAATPATQPVRIMPLGDSITYGLGSERLSSYRVELAQRLASAGVAVDYVGSNSSGPRGVDTDNEGHSGWRIGQIAARADGWMATYRPDVVLLHIGTNDMRSDDKAAGAAGRLGALVDQLLAASPDVRILVAKITGANDERVQRVYQRRIGAYNARIPAIVAERGARVRLVDQTGVDGTDLIDMLHPNDYGYKKMAWTWYRALQPVLGDDGRAWPMVKNPFQATSKHLREHTSAGDIGSWWHLRAITVNNGGGTVQVKRWQTKRTGTEKYRVKVPGKGYVTRTRTVTRWSSI